MTSPYAAGIDRQLRPFGRFLVAWVALVVVSSMMPASASASESGTAERIQAAVRFRAEFGLRGGLDFTLSTFDDPSFSSDGYGIPLDTSERDDLDARVRIQQAMGPLVEQAMSEPTFGGMFIDQTAGGTIQISLTRVDPRTELRLSSLAPAKSSVRFASASYTFAELQVLQATIASEMPDWATRGITVQTVGVDPVVNRVVVGVVGLTDAAQQTLIARYGPQVSLSPEAPETFTSCTGVTNCSDYMGGIKIQAPNLTACSSGFVGRKTSGAAAGDLFYLTAGHCIYYGGGTGVVWHQYCPGACDIGYAYGVEFANGMSADAAAIKLANGSSTPKHDIFPAPSGPARLINASAGNSVQTVGALICRTGYSSNLEACGHIKLANIDKTIQGYLMHHQWQGDITVLPGDSGGPVYVATTAYGIDSWGGTNVNGYGTIDWVSNSFGFRPCYNNSSPCG